MTIKSIHNQVMNIQDVINQIVNISGELDEKTIRWNPSEEEWSIMQVLSHLAEAIPYWVNEVDRVVEKPGSEWGRGLQDPARLKAVENTGQLSVQKTLGEVEALKTMVEKLSTISEKQLHAENPHRNFQKFGNKPVSFIIGHFIEEHVEKHLSQIKRNLSKLD
ncbi:DinB family protein [Geomicrobium sp. JCM 19039]|uniref:DinB family protein n=1 Tax=Geomicrobium sp. JCM 19039 TaxID=1460636 RepID=UPI00045F4309|nr:DinB family protein [Geomicrobium sp. JCM 19039]GAK12182.1 hypothetical protein JCM19039_1924 [Geomicrobium sp. JCM 19039]